MSTPHPEPVSEPKEMKWTEPFIGFLFALLVLTGLGVAAFVSYDSDGDVATTQETDDSHDAEESGEHD